jgi:shikimate kinase
MVFLESRGNIMNNLVFIGMPGVGKSTVGVVLAKVLGYKFVDSDIVIQEREKRLLHEIISTEGVEGFIEIENQVNASIETDKSIIATGGSVVYGKEAMEHLKSIGKVVYLKLSYEQIEKRLSDIKGRGVVLKTGQNLKNLYDERTLLYDKYADIVIDEENLSVEETITKIIEAIKI